MHFYPTKILEIIPQTEDAFVVRLSKPDGFSFIPGQHVTLKNPSFNTEEHIFSIASAPSESYLEFCIKIFGDWTEALSKLSPGASLEVSHAEGTFTFDTQVSYAVFLLGGIGISPIVSILRTLEHENRKTEIVLLYGNKTPQTKTYATELERLSTVLNLTVVDIYSEVSNNDPWSGYRGLITEDIIKKEVDLSKNPVFFFIGPPPFMEEMNKLLNNLNIPPENIRTEHL